MKSLLVFARILIVGCLWSIIFIEGIRVIMLCNWHFDIFWPDHWKHFIKLWKAGWFMRAPKEWAFVIILVTFIPMLITGWWTLSLIAWELIIFDILLSPINLYKRLIKAPINVITTNNKYGVVKRKSYKQIRPNGVSGQNTPISDYSDFTSNQPKMITGSNYNRPVTSPIQSNFTVSSPSAASNHVMNKVKPTDVPSTINHALFKFDDDDDFDLDIDSFEKSDVMSNNKPKSFDFDDMENIESSAKKQSLSSNKKKKLIDDDDDDESTKNSNKNSKTTKKSKNSKTSNNDESSSSKKKNKDDTKSISKNNSDSNEKSSDDTIKNPVYDTLNQKGYDIIQDIDIKGTNIDFVAIDENNLILCLIDKESGDWLADEELFNGEEPLWFSENGHRISPVRKLSIAKEIIKNEISNDFDLNIKSFVIIQAANIINADDMFETWHSSEVEVTRISRGAPKEIKLFSKAIDETETSLPKKEFEKLSKTLKSIK